MNTIWIMVLGQLGKKLINQCLTFYIKNVRDQRFKCKKNKNIKKYIENVSIIAEYELFSWVWHKTQKLFLKIKKLEYISQLFYLKIYHKHNEYKNSVKIFLKDKWLISLMYK